MRFLITVLFRVRVRAKSVGDYGPWSDVVQMKTRTCT